MSNTKQAMGEEISHYKGLTPRVVENTITTVLEKIIGRTYMFVESILENR